MKRTIALMLSCIFTVSIALSASDNDRKKGEAIAEPVPEGIVYSLPRTGIRIYVEVNHERFFHGPYAQYADKLLGLENVPVSDYETWAIQKIRFETFAEPDPDHYYKAMGQSAALVNLSPEGILAGINTPANTEENKLVTSNLIYNSPVPELLFPDLSLDDFYNEITDTIRGGVLVTKTVEERAFDVAQTIVSLRDQRFNTMLSDLDALPPDGKAYEAVIDELHRLEKEYVALFSGKKKATTHTYVFETIPASTQTKSDVIFRFSANKGVLQANDLSGKPVMIRYQKTTGQSQAQQSLAQSQNPDAGKSGIYYRMPGTADITLTDGLTPWAKTRTTIAQFGTIAPLPELFLDGIHQIIFHPETGAIKNIEK